MSSKRAALAVSTFVTVGALLLAGCGGPSSTTTSPTTPPDDSKSSVTIAVPQVVANWDPYKADYSFFMQPLQAAYDTLLRLQQDGAPGPGLAESYTWKDNKTLVLTLRKNVQFSDGAALTPEVVKQNLERAKTVTGPRTAEIKAVSSIDVTADTVTLNLSAPDPTIPLALTRNMGMMVSPTALAAPDSLTTTPAGTGPYTLNTAQSLVNDHYLFEYNPKYWNTTERHMGSITFKVIVDTTATLNAMRSGQVDAMRDTNAVDVPVAKSAGFTVIQTIANFYGLNLQDRGGTSMAALGKQEVRQALNYAVDRKALQQIVGDGQPSTQPYPPGQLGHDDSLDNAYSYDIAKAKSLLASAGYPNGITLDVLSLSLQDTYMQALQQQMAPAGITINIKDVPPPQYIADRNTTKTPVYFWFNSLSNSIADAKQNLLPTGAYNAFKVEDPQITQLVNQASSATSRDEQDRLMKQVSQIVVSKAYFLVTNFGTTNYFVNPKKIADMQLAPLTAAASIYGMHAP
jgi:peptide/nickel transport system substrate-binding protein